MKAIELRGLTKTFDGKPVLKGISMALERGDVCGFLGPNGAGKTTTLRILLGVLRADAGQVVVLGMDPATDGPALRQTVNVLPESHGFYDWMEAGDYLRFFAELYGRPLGMPDRRDRLFQVGLDSRDRRPIRTYSRGMKQRLGIARALLNDPQLLFLDEPTNGLDPKGRREVHNLLLALNQQRQMTIVISTHILDDVERLCNRVVILDMGNITYEGPLNAPAATNSLRYRLRIAQDSDFPSSWDFPGILLIDRKGPWLTCAIQGPPAMAIRALVDGGLQVVEAEPVSGGLEELYMSHTTGGRS